MTSTLSNRPAAAPALPTPDRSAASTASTTSTAFTTSSASAASTASTAELVKLAAEQVSTLVRDELKLAQIELTEKGKRAGLGVGMFGGAGVVALYGVGALLAALIIGLAAVMPAWLAALIVGVVLFAVAGVLALLGKGQVKRAVPAMPQETVANVKADVDTVSASLKHHNHNGHNGSTR